MKKFLFLLLVVGMASAANAAVIGLSVDGVNISDGYETFDPSETITLYVLSDTDDYPWLYEVSVATADATLGTPSPTPNAGSMADYIDYSDATIWDYELTTAGVPGTIKAGQQWIMSLAPPIVNLGSVFTVYLGPYGEPPVSSIEFVCIPEPMTLAFLGLGGLFLRRRK